MAECGLGRREETNDADGIGGEGSCGAVSGGGGDSVGSMDICLERRLVSGVSDEVRRMVGTNELYAAVRTVTVQRGLLLDEHVICGEVQTVRRKDTASDGAAT